MILPRSRVSAGVLRFLPLLALLLLAALLRFGWVGVNSFAFDEARLSLISLRMARGGEFALLGMPSSAGVPNLPGAAWVFAIPYAFSPDPLVATWFVGLLSLGVVFGVWWLARSAWGGWAAFAAGLYMAASPFAVLYARSVWAQDLLPVLGVLWLWSAYVAVTRKRGWALALHVFVAGFAVQVHFAGAALALGSLFLFVRWRWWRRWRPALTGAGLAALTFIPPLLATLNDPSVAAQFRSAVGGGAQVDLTAVGELLRLALAWDWAYLAAGDWPPAIDPAVTAVLVAPLLAAGLVTLVGLLGTGKAATEARVLAELALVLLAAAPLFFIRHSTPVFLHYLLAALPALALMVGAALRLRRSALWRWLATGWMVLIGGVWVLQIAQNLDAAARTDWGNGLGTPLGITRSVAYAVPADLPVVFFTHGDDANVHGEAAVFEALWWGREHRIVQGESVALLPRTPAYLLASLAPFQAWEALEAAGLAQDVDTYPRREGEGEPFVGTRYDGVAEPQGFIRVEPVPFADGAQLEGWGVRWVGPRLRVSTLLRVGEGPFDASVQQFHHLRDAASPEGEPLQVADVPVSARRWQAGDRLIVMADFFDVAPGEYWVDVGHYTLPDVTRLPRADGEGDSVQLGPFEVEPPAAD